MLRAAMVRASAAVLSVLALTTAGCGSQCDRHPDDAPIVWDGGTTVNGVYMSAPQSGPFLDFPPGRTYRFENQLGGAPIMIESRFSFNPYPFDGGQNSAGSVFAAGNQATLQHACADYFDLRNDTCSEVYIWVSASDPDPSSANACGPGDGVDSSVSNGGDAGATQKTIDASTPISDATPDVAP